jgi:predicted enzyme related to lactoylglutathione lyase
LNAWYGEHLGLAIDPFGSPFEFRNADRPNEKNYLRWSTMPEGEPYLAAGNYPFMINYRVNNIEGLIRNLEASGVEMLDSLASYDYGKFIHFIDPQGNQVELWEPVDSVLTAMGGETTH